MADTAVTPKTTPPAQRGLTERLGRKEERDEKQAEDACARIAKHGGIHEYIQPYR